MMLRKVLRAITYISDCIDSMSVISSRLVHNFMKAICVTSSALYLSPPDRCST